MADCDSSSPHGDDKNNLLFQRYESSEDEGRRLKRREKNRVAAQKSRKRQTQRADILHEAYEYLEQRNSQLKREVDFLSEQQRLLSEVLRVHEPFCPIMPCSLTSCTSSNPVQQPSDTATPGI